MNDWWAEKGYSSHPLSCFLVDQACWARPAVSAWISWPPPRSASQLCASSARWTGCYVKTQTLIRTPVILTFLTEYKTPNDRSTRSEHRLIGNLMINFSTKTHTSWTSSNMHPEAHANYKCDLHYRSTTQHANTLRLFYNVHMSIHAHASKTWKVKWLTGSPTH